MRLAYLVLLGSVVGSNGAGCGYACTLIGCTDSFTITFEEGSTWGEGRHEVIIDSREAPPLVCSVYPYYSGVNWFCQGEFSIQFSADGLSMNFAPDQITLIVRDESGWEFSQTFEPEYEENYPNGKKCDKTPCLSASDSVRLDGPGEEAAESTTELDYERVWGSSGGGAGGMSSEEADVGSACEKHADCQPPQFCSDDFMGGLRICSQSCDEGAACPEGTVCASSIVSDDHEIVDGYCLRPCDSQADCESRGTVCRLQPAGTFCF